MKSRTSYAHFECPLFIAEKFFSSGLFAGPPTLPTEYTPSSKLEAFSADSLRSLTSVAGLQSHSPTRAGGQYLLMRRCGEVALQRDCVI